MKAKSPMLKALIGNQGNLNAGLRSAIEAAPTKMKKESMAKMKKESSMKMKKESSMKMMDKESPAKTLVLPMFMTKKEKLARRAKRDAEKTKKLKTQSISEDPVNNEKNKNINKKQKENKKKKEEENSKKLLKDYNNPKRKDPFANLTGPKKPNIKKEKTTVNLVEKNPKKIVKKDKVKKDDKKADPLTKNIMNTNQKGDEGLKATVKNRKSNKQVSEREYRKNRKGGESKFQYMKRMKKKK